jgi:hypothetical protein
VKNKEISDLFNYFLNCKDFVRSTVNELDTRMSPSRNENDTAKKISWSKAQLHWPGIETGPPRWQATDRLILGVDRNGNKHERQCMCIVTMSGIRLTTFALEQLCVLRSACL